MPTTCFVACAAGLEKILESELLALGVKRLKLRRAGVDCALDLAQIYRVCLWSRVANRVLYPLTAFKIDDEKHYYQQLKTVDWSKHLTASGTLAVDFFCADSVITHSRYGAQLTKDAVVDWFRDETGQRPSVDRDTPDVRINVYLYKNRARVSLDMAGSSLHRRNYRQQSGQAPLKENLAAAILLAAQWPSLAASGAPLFDPMCGSGTLLIEAGLIACGKPPGALRQYFGFTGWLQHNKDLWQEVHHDALQQVQQPSGEPRINGADVDARAVSTAQTNIEAAGLADIVTVRCEDFFESSEALGSGPGLLITNPPYGERLEDSDTIAGFYSQFGRAAKRRAANWQLALFTGKPELFHRTGLSRRVLLECANGGIDCKLLVASIPPLSAHAPQSTQKEQPKPENCKPAGRAPDGTSETSAANAPASANVPGLDQFSDRLRKNLKQLKGWARSAGITNYRVYDADLPDFAIAVDVYGVDTGPYVCVQEYRAPATIDPVRAQQRLDGAVAVVAEVLHCQPDNLAIKRRERQRAEAQYQRLEKTGQTHEVSENECRVLINLHDYLDVGLFLDHRKVRQWIGKVSAGKRFLNLYCYTAVATLHAAVGGASSSVSVDLSHKYLEWAAANFERNGIDRQQHELVHADCGKWLQEYVDSHTSKEPNNGGFDLIFLDPPTFSNSTSMETDWDVQRDHESMIDRCMAILKPGGTLVFSNNFRRFRLAQDVSAKFRVENRSRWSLQRDFSRNPRIHQCWFIQHADG